MGGAVEKAWFSLGPTFVELGHSVTHISREFPSLPKSELIAGVQHHRVAGANAVRSLALRLLLDLIYSKRTIRSLPKADILITNTFWLPILCRTKDYGLQYVHIARYPKGQLRLYAPGTVLQTVSTPIRAAILREVPSRAADVSVIPYALPKEYLLQQVKKRGLQIIYIGRIHPEKGVHLLIDAFIKVSHAIAGWELTIIGPFEYAQGGGGPQYLQGLKVQAEGFPVKFRDPIFDSKELLKAYDSGSIFVYPSLAEKGETFGLAILEAMARGNAVVCSRLECFTDLIEDQVTGIQFDHRAAEASSLLSQRILRLCMDSSLREKIAMQAVQKAGSFGLKKISERFCTDFKLRLSLQSKTDENTQTKLGI